jgi:hypothetical protein
MMRIGARLSSYPVYRLYAPIPRGAVSSSLARLFVFIGRRDCYPGGHTITSSELVIRYLEGAASPARF